MVEKAKRGRGRPKGFVMSEGHRLKIQNSNILSMLIKNAECKQDMSSGQVSSALGLLKKIMPDLSAITMDAEVKHDLSDDMKMLMNLASEKTKRVGE